MKELDNISANYAAGKANEVMEKAIAQAYADGYRDGYKDREEEIPVDLRDNKMEYIDLGLSSGTLWAKDFEKDAVGFLYLPYMQAKNYNLPTREQWDELVQSCEWGWYGQVIRCTGKNGATLDFPKTGRVLTTYGDGNNSYLWLLENTFEDKNAFIYLGSPWTKEIDNCFMGFKLPIRQVR